MSANTPITKGDNTAAFGNNYITINLNNPLNYVISKAEFVVNNGCPKLQPINNPNFPIVINFDSQQSTQLQAQNTGKLVVWDELGRQKTCKGTLVFYAENGVICNVCQR